MQYRYGLSAIALAVTTAFAGPLWAQTTASPVQLERITVIGEKTERSLADTAASVSVTDERQLKEDPSLNTVNNVLDGVPNITSTGTQNLAPAVRGVDGTGPAQGADAFLAGTRPRLGIQLDGRSASYNEVVFGDLSTWDVKQIEVYRGAQSLLQGRNSIAGTVVVKTNDPSFEREVGFRVVAASHKERQYGAVFNLPLVADELAFRLAMDRQVSESFVDGFEAYPGVNDPGEYESRTVRAKFLLQPKALPGFSTLLTLVHTDHINPQTESVNRPFSDEQISFPTMPVFAPRANSGILDMTWKLSSLVTLENRIAKSDFRISRYAEPGDGNARIDGKDLTIEPRIRFTGEDTQGFLGVFYFDTKQDEFIDLFGGGTFDDETHTKAVYAELTHALASDLKLTLGARYEEERRQRDGSLFIFAIDLDETYHAFMPKAVLSWEPVPGLTMGAGASRGYNGGGAGFTFDPPFESYTFDPEYVWTYEAFTRAELLGGKLRLTGNLFYSDYKDMQLPFDLNPDPNVWSYVVRNADRAKTYGLELGAQWLVASGLRLNAEIGLLKTEITQYDDASLEGNDLARAPALTANFGVHYRHASGFEVGGNARYSESYYSSVENLGRGKTDPYWIVNTRFAYNLRDYRLFAFVNNVLDEDTPLLFDADPAGLPADDTAILPRPRTLGVGIEAWF